jgi:L-rhamnose mutarotase
MRLTPGSLAEYKRHHDAIWPELAAEIERQGIAKITIFEADPVLFLYSEIYDEGAWDRLWHSPIHDRWGEVMDPLMEFGPDGIVDAHQVREIWHLETSPTQVAAAGEAGGTF